MTREFDTFVEVAVRVLFEDGADGPEITRYFLGQPDARDLRIFKDEARAIIEAQTADANLEHKLSRRDEQ